MIITWRIIYFKASCSNTIAKKMGIMFCSNQNCQGHSGENKVWQVTSVFLNMLKFILFLYWKMFSRNVLLFIFLLLLYLGCILSIFESMSCNTELQGFLVLKNLNAFWILKENQSLYFWRLKIANKGSTRRRVWLFWHGTIWSCIML